MVRSMFAAVAGLRTHQAKMDVIGNNIANVNTWGYKAASMSFKDTMYQNTSNGSKGNAETGGYGGTNANQIGYGVTTGSISYDFSKGSPTPSARGLDCMIDGTGFFIVGPMVEGGTLSLDSENAIKSSGLYLSRVGKFDVDGNGYLIDDEGNYVYGFKNTGDLTKGDTFDKTALQPLKIPSEEDMAGVSNKNASDGVADAKKAIETASADLSSFNAALATARQDFIVADEALKAAKTTVNYDTLKTNADTAKTASDAAFDKWKAVKDDASVSAADKAQAKTDYKNAELAYQDAYYKFVQAEAEVSAPKILATYKTATPVTQLQKAWDDYSDAFNKYWGGTGTAADLETAKNALVDIQKAIGIIEDDSPQGKFNDAKLKVDEAQKKVEKANTNLIIAKNGLVEAQKKAADIATGNAGADKSPANLTSYQILDDGSVVGSADGNSTVIIGKIAVAGVQNTSGLEKTSGYYYAIGENAGNVSAYEGKGTQGKILGNYLEMAKVDLATEMTDMITTQRGYQANSKIITVTDQMLEELVNLKR